MILSKLSLVARAAFATFLIGSTAASQTGASGAVLRLVAPSPPGSGWDQLARTLESLAPQVPGGPTITVSNVPGTSGTVGLAQFAADGEDGLLVTGLTMLDATLIQRSPVSLDRMAPIARLAVEPFVVAVPAASPWTTIDDLRTAMWAEPGRVTWAGGPAGGVDHVAAALFARAIGVDPMRLNYVPFLASADAAAALADGKVAAAILAAGEVAAEPVTARLRVLAVASPDEPSRPAPPAGPDITSGGAPESGSPPPAAVPTLASAGIPLTLSNWRGLLGRPGLGVAERDRLAAAVERLTALPGWREMLGRKTWDPGFLGPAAFSAFLREEHARVKDALKAVGVLKRPSD